MKPLVSAKLVAMSLALGLVLNAAAAEAHAQLQKAIPAVGSKVARSPSEISLHFSEGVEPRFSTITLATAGGESIEVGRAATLPGDATVLVSKVLKPLKAGTYEVVWHVVSVDTHRTQGSFHFTVGP